MMKGFQNTLFVRAVDRALKSNPRRVVFPIYDRLNSCCLLVEDMVFDRSTPEINTLKSFADVRLIRFSNQKRGVDIDYNTVYIDDLNWYGVPKKEKFRDLISHPFDVLINMSEGSVGAFEYLSAASQAKFKVGLRANTSIYDLVIELSGSQVNELLPQFLETIKRLKSKY